MFNCIFNGDKDLNTSFVNWRINNLLDVFDFLTATTLPDNVPLYTGPKPPLPILFVKPFVALLTWL